MEVKRVFDLLERAVELYPKEDILAQKKEGKWEKISTQEYYTKSHLLAYSFNMLGLESNEKIITISNNRPEWNFIDMGCMLSNNIHVPIYSTLSDSDYEFIIEHSDAKLIFVGNSIIGKKIASIIHKLNKEIILVGIEPFDKYLHIKDLYNNGLEANEIIKDKINSYKNTINETDIATIIYTSGTTGTPKGVMLSHKNLVFNFLSHAVQQIKDNRHKMLSFLPLCHIYERSMNYEYQYLGISTYYAESLSTIASDLADCNADGFCAVPRVLEMMFNKLENASKDLKGISKTIYLWAFNLACNYDYSKKSLLYKLQHLIADKLVYSKWRSRLGGKEMLIVSGGSSIQEKIIRLFTAAKLYIFEGYGMTETSPVIAVNNPKEMIIKIGTVGKVVVGTEVKLAEDGEILVRGPHVMLGYYKDPDYTKEVIDSEGWFHTGDIGQFVDTIFLKITDRKKEIFKLSAGKYIAPQIIENRIKESSYIDNCMVIGANEKFASAIINLNKAKVEEFCNNNNILLNVETLNSNIELYNFIEKEISKINKTLAAHENIKRFRIVIDDWSPINGLLSQTLKLKRSKILEKYSSLVEEIYNLK